MSGLLKANQWSVTTRAAASAPRCGSSRYRPRRMAMTDSIALPTHLVAVDHATASAILGISPSRLRHHVRLGDLASHFSGTKPLYAISELERFVEDLPTRPGHLPVV